MIHILLTFSLRLFLLYLISTFWYFMTNAVENGCPPPRD